MTETVVDTRVTLTDRAAAKIAELLEQEDPGLAVRVVAEPGGCSGMFYQLYFDDQSQDGDIEQVEGTVRLVIDPTSAPFVTGSTIDYVENKIQQGFTIDNPNMAGGCSCGDNGGGCACGGGSCGCSC